MKRGALVLWLAAGAAAAAERTPLTLEEALGRAERGNAELRTVRAEADAAAARADAAARSTWPRLSAQADLSRTDNPPRVFASKLNRGELGAQDFAVERLNDPAALGHLTAALGAEASLDVFGKGRAQARAAQALGRSAGALADEARQDLRLRVTEAYRRTVLAEAAVRVTARALGGARAREAELEARVAEGAALKADLLRSRSRRRQREADLAERESDARVAGAVLARLLGASDEERLAPEEGVALPEPLRVERATALATAPAQRASVRVARERLEAAGWALKGTRRGLLPDVAAYGALQHDRGALDAGKSSFSVGVNLRWTAFDPTLTRRTAAAAADERAARAALEGLQAQARLEAATAFERAGAARERYAAAAGGVEEGREALRVIQERRAAGMATLTDELETEAASLAMELEELRAATDAALADAALARALGTL